MTENENYKLKNPELEAEIYYLTTEEGGRNSYVVSGYRGQFHYNGKDWDAPQEFIVCNPLSPIIVPITKNDIEEYLSSPKIDFNEFLKKLVRKMKYKKKY